MRPRNWIYGKGKRPQNKKVKLRKRNQQRAWEKELDHKN